MSDRIRSLGDFLSLLRGVKADRDGEYKALCPGHDDHEPSFSVREADGKILVQCFAGCKPVDILKPLNLEVKDLFLDDHKSKVKGQKKLVATFSYEIEKGKEAFQIRRYDLGNGKKTFEAWHETVGDRPVTAAELVAHLNDSAELRAALPDSLADVESKSYSVRLGQRLASVMWKVVRLPPELRVPMTKSQSIPLTLAMSAALATTGCVRPAGGGKAEWLCSWCQPRPEGSGGK
jgi:hypothetical protein